MLYDWSKPELLENVSPMKKRASLVHGVPDMPLTVFTALMIGSSGVRPWVQFQDGSSAPTEAEIDGGPDLSVGALRP